MYKTLSLIGVLMFAALPASNDYKLDSYGIGSGGTADSSSSNYRIEGVSGEISGTQSDGSVNINSGFVYTEQANVPKQPTFTNDNNWYNKLHLVIDPSNNPSDAKFAIAISSDGFSNTQYVQDDNTIGSVLGLEDYQTYAQWGGSSGFNIIGLDPDTTYDVKIKATAGDFTETGYGPNTTASTVNPTISFDLDISSSDSETSAPYVLDMGMLLTDTVVTPTDRIWTDFETNADHGGTIYVVAQNGGLSSTASTYTITAITGDLSAQSEGFGAQSESVSQDDGGPLTTLPPYNGSGASVGITDNIYRKMYESENYIYGGRSSFYVKARSNAMTPAATDYSEVLTVIATSQF